MINKLCILLYVMVINKTIATTTRTTITTRTTEAFVCKIEPSMFNWTLSASYTGTNIIDDDQYTYTAALIDKPDLPEWIKYKYSKKYHCGYLYGVATNPPSTEQLRVIALNHLNYETRVHKLNIDILEKTNRAKYEIELKIDNLNIDDMFYDGQHNLHKLMNIFKYKLWHIRTDMLYLTFIDTTINLGGRLPLHPLDMEGVVLRIGSHLPFTTELLELHDEVKPLYKFKTGASCPRDFKRTTVDRLFRDEGFALDWCSFQLIYKLNNTNDDSFLKQEQELVSHDLWLNTINKYQIPMRNYSNEFLYTIILPVIIMSICVWLLSFTLCFQHEGITDHSYDRFIHSLFDICYHYYSIYYLKSTKRNKQQEQPLTTPINTNYNNIDKTTNSLSMRDTENNSHELFKNPYNTDAIEDDHNGDDTAAGDNDDEDNGDNDIMIIKNIINTDDIEENQYKAAMLQHQRKLTTSSFCNHRCPSPPPYPGIREQDDF